MDYYDGTLALLASPYYVFQTSFWRLMPTCFSRYKTLQSHLPAQKPTAKTYEKIASLYKRLYTAANPEQNTQQGSTQVKTETATNECGALSFEALNYYDLLSASA